MDSKKTYIHLIPPRSGCPMRTLETSKLGSYFELNNCNITDNPENADYILFVTCAVTKNSIEDALNVIKHLQSFKGELIVMGCLPGTNKKELNSVFAGRTVVTKNITDIDTIFTDFRIRFEEVPEAFLYDFGSENTFAFQKKHHNFFSLIKKYGLSNAFKREWIRNKDLAIFYKLNKKYKTDKCFIILCSGCVNNCSYCNIKKAIGKIKSKSIEKLKNEYFELITQGYRLFHFIAEDLCSYGFDINSSLKELLSALSEVDKDYNVKWSLHGINPEWLINNANNVKGYIRTKKIWEMTVAVESASEKVVELMNRKYEPEKLVDAFKMMRKENIGLRLNALFIVGFPTETDEDFDKSLKMMREVKFDDVTLIAYSEADSIASSKIFPKVDEKSISKRIERGKSLLKKLKTPFIR